MGQMPFLSHNQQWPQLRKMERDVGPSMVSDASINWESCGRKGTKCENGVDGGGNLNELASSWIISMDAPGSLNHSQQGQKQGRITITVRRVQRRSRFGTEHGRRAVLWSPCHWFSHELSNIMPLTLWYWLTHHRFNELRFCIPLDTK